VLVSPEGPVIIDFHQAVDPARNQNARGILLRDVANLDRFLARFVARPPRRRHAEVVWDLYARGALGPDARRTARGQPQRGPADLGAVLRESADADRDATRQGRGPSAPAQGAPSVPGGPAPRRRVEVLGSSTRRPSAEPRREERPR